ncbi:MAG: YheU family protein [Deltaproteobacteria bacterium]|nr:YheU family protein [Deltaproteobacteria bacterium]
MRKQVRQKPSKTADEEGVEIPSEQLNPDTLRRLIQEFVSRDGADWDQVGCTLDDKVEQVLRQLKTGRAKIVFDRKTQTANFVACPK